jgi:tRNA (guanine-N7-)-methyltransferase
MNDPRAPGSAGTPKQRRILYGRRKARKLRPAQTALVEDLLPRIEITTSSSGAKLQVETLFPDQMDSVWLEVGFGAGEHMIEQASAHPRVGFIGCEPYLNGVVKALAGIQARRLSNVRLYRDDARILLDRLPSACLGRVFILFPDPWPKTRHHKRRFVSPYVLQILARVMIEEAELRIATDDSDYLAWMLEHVLRHGAFEWLARRPVDWRERPDGWPATRYEIKAMAAGRRCAFLRFRRRHIVN